MKESKNSLYKKKYKNKNFVFLTKFLLEEKSIHNLEALIKFIENKKICTVIIIQKIKNEDKNIVLVLMEYGINVFYSFLIKTFFDLNLYTCDIIQKLFDNKNYKYYLLKFDDYKEAKKYNEILKEKERINNVKEYLKNFNYMIDTFLLKDGILFLKREDFLLYKLKYI